MSATLAAPPAPAPFDHRPVLLAEVVALARAAGCPAGALVVDATVGGGGHAAALLAALPGARLVGLDRDPAARAAAALRLAPTGGTWRVGPGRLGDVAGALAALGEVGPAAVLLADLGVSSPQIDRAERGFSWRFDAPLDMRMGGDGPTAAAWLAAASERQIADTLWALGDERHARRIARRIAALAPAARPATTWALAELVAACVPRRPGGHHPATRTFQALRIRINQEQEDLAALLAAVPALLAPGGLFMCITFHSLEDRLVKRALVDHARTCSCPPRAPWCVCGRQPALRRLAGGGRIPTAAELAANPRARSARLRAARRL